MKIVLLLSLVSTMFFSCTVLVDPQTVKCIRVKRTEVHLTSEHKFWTDHLRLKKDGHWSYYSSFFGFERMAIIRGRYAVNGNEISMSVCNNDSLPWGLTGQGVIYPGSGRIVLFANDNVFNATLYVKKGNLKKLK